MVKLSARLFLPALVIAAAAIALTMFFSTGSPNAVVVEGVLISSGSGSPLNAFSELSSSASFVVSPQLYEPVITLDQYMFNGAALFIQVLEGNRKNTVQLIRVYSHENEMLYCLTNWGDVSTEERLSVGQCNDLLQQGENAIVLIQFPDSSMLRPAIELQGRQITVKPKSYEDIGGTCFLALRIMYKNSRDIVDASNMVISKIS